MNGPTRDSCRLAGDSGVRAIILVAALVVLASCGRMVPRRDSEVIFRNGEVTLAGTFSVPEGPARRRPVAVFVSGDGPQDRDTSPVGLFHLLADSLVAHGIAVLRHDDRGAGRSTTPPGAPSYHALLGDTRAAISFVRGRSEVDAGRVFLVGHSEGAKTCEVLAAEDTRIAGIALLAGATAVNVDTLLEEQARRSPDGFAPRLLPTLARAKAGERSRDAHDLTDWMREHLEIAPRSVLPQIRCPVLIVQAEADGLVRAHHGAEAAMLIERGGNRRVTVRTLPDLTHEFSRSTPAVSSPAAARADPIVGGAVAQWIASVASR